jgi:hypothetical protein
MGDTLVGEGGQETTQEAIASIVAHATIPAGLAQSEACRRFLGSNPRGTPV